MKRLLVASFAILLMAGVAFAVQSPGHGDKLNQGGLPSDPGKIFRLVRYVAVDNDVNASTLTADSLVVWDTVSDDGVTVTTTTTSGDAAVAGIIPIAIQTPDTLGRTAFQDVGKRNWGWVQTYGLADIWSYSNDSVASANAPICAGNEIGKAGIARSLATGVQAEVSCGFAYDAVTADLDDEQVFLKCD